MTENMKSKILTVFCAGILAFRGMAVCKSTNFFLVQ